MLTFDLQPVPELVLCCDCKHSAEDGYCERVGASMSFARRMRTVCGADAILFESVDNKKEPGG